MRAGLRGGQAEIGDSRSFVCVVCSVCVCVVQVGVCVSMAKRSSSSVVSGGKDKGKGMGKGEKTAGASASVSRADYDVRQTVRQEYAHHCTPRVCHAAVRAEATSRLAGRLIACLSLLRVCIRPPPLWVLNRPGRRPAVVQATISTT